MSWKLKKTRVKYIPEGAYDEDTELFAPGIYRATDFFINTDTGALKQVERAATEAEAKNYQAMFSKIDSGELTEESIG